MLRKNKFPGRLEADMRTRSPSIAPAAERAGRIDGDDADGESGIAEPGGESVYKSTFAGAGWPGYADKICIAAMGEIFFP